VSRAVSADFVVCVCPLVRLMRRPSTLSALAECCRGTSVFTDPLAAVLVNVHRLGAVLRLYPRGLFGRSFLHATVPQPVPSWTPAERQSRPRPGAIRPTPMKSVRSSCGTPRRSIIRNTPGQRPGPGDTSSWRGAAGIRMPKPRINTVTRADLFPPIVQSCIVHFSDLGGGQGNGGNRPERHARARRGMRVDRRVHPCSFAIPTFLFELHALNPSGVRGTPPGKHSLQSSSAGLQRIRRPRVRRQKPQIPGASSAAARSGTFRAS
jgi:hypothetical protein